MPEIPTTAEAGLPGVEIEIWLGAFAPKGTPQEAVTRLTADINRVLEMPEVRERIAPGGSGNRRAAPPSDSAIWSDPRSRNGQAWSRSPGQERIRSSPVHPHASRNTGRSLVKRLARTAHAAGVSNGRAWLQRFTALYGPRGTALFRPSPCRWFRSQGGSRFRAAPSHPGFPGCSPAPAGWPRPAPHPRCTQRSAR